MMPETSYAIALGSNRRHGRHGSPSSVLARAVEEIGAFATVTRVSNVRLTPAMGPAGRRFANAALLARSGLPPLELLARLQSLERAFGRRSGRRWGPRVLDLDIILFSAGVYRSRRLNVPHPAFRSRRFVLEPLLEIAPRWRDPVSGHTVRQLAYRARAHRPVDRSRTRL